jgi:hypothetical protein
VRDLRRGSKFCISEGAHHIFFYHVCVDPIRLTCVALCIVCVCCGSGVRAAWLLCVGAVLTGGSPQGGGEGTGAVQLRGAGSAYSEVDEICPVRSVSCRCSLSWSEQCSHKLRR